MPVRRAHQRDLGRAVGQQVHRDRLVEALPQDREVVDGLSKRGVVRERSVVHVDGHHLVALPEQVVECDRGIDPPAHQHHAPRHRPRPPGCDIKGCARVRISRER